MLKRGCFAFEGKFTLLSAQKSDQKSGFAKKIFKSCSKLVSKSARNVGYKKIFKSCWPAAALGLSIINVTFRVLRRLEFAADISGTCAQIRELSSHPTDQPPCWKHSTELQGLEFLLSFTAVRLHVYLVFVKSIEQELKIQ